MTQRRKARGIKTYKRIVDTSPAYERIPVKKKTSKRHTLVSLAKRIAKLEKQVAVLEYHVTTKIRRADGGPGGEW
jgi:hypothetical protein